MDVASQAYNCGAQSVIAVDIQKPAASGKEMENAVAKGTRLYGRNSRRDTTITEKRLYFKDGTSLDADLVIMSVGDVPILDFLPPSIHTERGWIAGERYRPDIGRKGVRHRRRDPIRSRDPCDRPGEDNRRDDPLSAHACPAMAGDQTGHSV